MRTIEFKGHTFDYKGKLIKSYVWQKRATSGVLNQMFWAFEQLFDGRDEEYAELLGGETEDIQELLVTIINKAAEESQEAKN